MPSNRVALARPCDAPLPWAPPGTFLELFCQATFKSRVPDLTPRRRKPFQGTTRQLGKAFLARSRRRELSASAAEMSWILARFPSSSRFINQITQFALRELAVGCDAAEMVAHLAQHVDRLPQALAAG